MKLVFIDLDGALIDGPATESMFFDYLNRRGVLRLRNYLSYFAYMLRGFFGLGGRSARYNQAYLSGMRRADVDIYADSFAKKVLYNLVRPEMWDRIEAHAEAGDVLVLMADVPDFLLRSLARKLEIKYYYGIVCDYLGNKYGSAPPKIIPAGSVKVDIAKALAAKLKLGAEDLVAYADGEEDLPLLEFVGNPVLVYPEGKLLDKVNDRVRDEGWEQIG